jgi:hypothetical protein
MAPATAPAAGSGLAVRPSTALVGSKLQEVVEEPIPGLRKAAILMMGLEDELAGIPRRRR